MILASKEVESVLAAADPVSALIEWVKTTHSRGASKPEIIALLVECVGREKDADKKDALTDVLDALHGWSHPESALLVDNEK